MLPTPFQRSRFRHSPLFSELPRTLERCMCKNRGRRSTFFVSWSVFFRVCNGTTARSDGSCTNHGRQCFGVVSILFAFSLCFAVPVVLTVQFHCIFQSPFSSLLSSRVFPNCLPRVASQSVFQECLQECLPKVSSKGVSQECLPKGLPRVSLNSVLQECLPSVSLKSVVPKCLSRVFSQSVFQECASRVCLKSVFQESLPRVSAQSVFLKCLPKVSSKSVSQECHQCISRACLKRIFQECLTRVSS